MAAFGGGPHVGESLDGAHALGQLVRQPVQQGQVVASDLHLDGGAEAEVRETLLPAVSKFFSSSTAYYLDKILFHWNTWGWDVLPLVLWLAFTYNYLFKKNVC